MIKRNKGFTLIELLVVIAIIGLLATLTVASLNSARAKSRDARRISDIKTIQTALELFYNDTGHYPNGAETAAFGLGACLNSTGFIASGAACAEPVYLKSYPADPSYDTAYDYVERAPVGTSYTVAYSLENPMSTICVTGGAVPDTLYVATPKDICDGEAP